MIQILLLPLIVYAACGLVLSLSVHLLALAGFQPGGMALFAALHVGIFPLWIPVVLIAIMMTRGTRLTTMGWSLWKPILSGCPAWMRYMAIGFLSMRS